ncbi:Uncharacterized protein HSR121_1733 [Halapricum desulfuricans]|uniref:Uncharacterized protein n=1 Tax=Halapricum desulfuricans TaxID=2841257 RepID=A0A897N4R8_9EURY|nr:Uncharacterized protein HSR121_1733 [Halapricum desulfuricans]
MTEAVLEREDLTLLQRREITETLWTRAIQFDIELAIERETHPHSGWMRRSRYSGIS